MNVPFSKYVSVKGLYIFPDHAREHSIDAHFLCLWPAQLW